MIYSDLPENIVSLKLEQFGISDKDKISKLKLHQIYSAFFNGKINYTKLLKILDSMISSNAMTREIVFELMKYHTSTKERRSNYEEIYSQIFTITGKPSSILDIACGFNPLSKVYFDFDCYYESFDMGTKMINFINKVLKDLSLDSKTNIFTGDVFTYEFKMKFDLVFLFKALQVFEMQEKGYSEKLLQKIKANYIVISFPTKTLTGKNKGLEFSYSDFTENLIKNYQFSTFAIDNEKFYIVKMRA